MQTAKINKNSYSGITRQFLNDAYHCSKRSDITKRNKNSEMSFSETKERKQVVKIAI